MPTGRTRPNLGLSIACFFYSQAERDRLVANFMTTLSSQNVADRPEITLWNTILQD